MNGILAAAAATSLLAVGCSSYQVAKDVKLLSFKAQPSAQEESVGSITGKSCQWNLFGWPLSEAPTLRSAFDNAVEQKSGQAKLSVLRNVTSEDDFLGLYVVSRACVKVSGLGAR
ncbi:MAG: hypothetical protein EOP05_01950 [Proteobacteria bacterium]|nr:MAG: hypothetical protein EOP05_01950 [Pseudomonadota bacterium]